MEQIMDWDSEIDDILLGFTDSPPCLPPFSDSTILTFPPPPPCDISSSLHSSSNLYSHEPPQPHSDFEKTPIIYPIYDPTLFAEFEAPQPPSMAMVAPSAKGVFGVSFSFPDTPPFLPPFSDSTILTFPPPPPCDIPSSPHSNPKRHHISSDLYIHELPQQYFEIIPDYDPTAFAEFEVPQQPSIAVVSGLSAQTMAARGRRKRISEKMLELGGLIPGGNRMNTAQMLQAAFKYLKFLQAQHDVLDSLPVPVCESVEEEHWLGSMVVQEKLSAIEMCVVPKEIVDEFVDDPNLNLVR